MIERDETRKHFAAFVRRSVGGIAIMIWVVQAAAAQDPSLTAPQSALGAMEMLKGGFGAGLSLSPTAGARSTRWQRRDAPLREPLRSASTDATSVRDGVQRITLEQVKQQAVANPAANPLARLGQLSIEAAKQHRLGVQADYFPKLGATFANLHYSDFLGEVVAVRRPLRDSLVQVPIPVFSQNQTIAAVTFIQPITPLFEVHQAVKIARADERIAMAKAGVSVTKNLRDPQIEEVYFRLLIAQRHLISAELKLRDTENRRLYAATSIESVRSPGPESELVEARQALLSAETEVRERTTSLNRVMGWPDETKLELLIPAPLVENVSLEEVADKSLVANPDVIEAEQTVVKARAASVLSKLAYVPTVAAVGGYLFQNAIPLVPSNFGYGGVMASYTLFDFGKRERAVKEARAQLGMAEIGLQLTKAKIADNLKKSYFELEQARQLSQLAQKMGSSMIRMMNVSSAPETLEMKATRAKAEEEMLETDLAHRQALAHLKALMDPRR
jgi:outer membrane protein